MKQNKQKVTKERKQITRKRNLLNFALVAIIGIGSGIFLGSWYSFSVLSTTVDYSSYSEATLRDDVNTVVAKATKITNPSASDKANWQQIAAQKNVTPQNLTAAENIVLAEHALNNASSFAVKGTGKIATIATQSVYSSNYFNGTTYLAESISKGILTVAECTVMQKGGSSVTTIKGNNVTENSASWNGNQNTITAIEAKEKHGVTPNNVIPYIISSKTILTNSTITKSVVNGQNVYTFSVTLDPIKGVLNYVKQVKQTSGLSDYPTFNDITITVVMDESWNFKEFNIVENYRVIYSGLKPKCKGTLNLKFDINTDVTLPEYVIA